MFKADLFIYLAFSLLVSGFISAEQDSHLFHASSSAESLTSIESEPSGIIDGCVNVITGEFIDGDVDLMIPGPEPLKIERILTGNNPHPLLGVCGSHWRFNDYADLYFKSGVLGKNGYEATFSKGMEYSTSFLLLENKKNKHAIQGLILSKGLIKGITNTSKGGISAQTVPQNRKLTWSHTADCANMTMEDGTILLFKDDRTLNLSKHCHRMVLQRERLPCGLSLNYFYTNQHDLESVFLKSSKDKPLSSYKIEGYYAHYPTKIVASDDRYVCYDFEYGEDDHPLLKSVTRSDAPPITFTYYPRQVYSYSELPKELWLEKFKSSFKDKEKLARKSYPHNRFKEVVYYAEGMSPLGGHSVSARPHEPHFGRVSQLIAPLESDSTPHLKYRFYYYLPKDHKGGGCAGVYDALDHKTDYGFNYRQRLTGITKYFANNTPYTNESLYWGSQEDTQEAMRLLARTFKVEGSPYEMFARVYSYDKKGNIKADSLYGNICGLNEPTLQTNHLGKVSGQADCFQKTYAYSQDDYHLLIESKVGALRKTFQYLPKTNLLEACLHHNEQGIFLRHFYSYDENAMVIEHIVDDGSCYDRNDLTNVTERKIERTERTSTYPVGLPQVLREFYWDQNTGQEKLFLRKVNTHDSVGHLIRQETYDCNDQFAYAEEWTYDAHGNLIQEINRLGQTILREFDDLDNMIYLRGIDTRLQQRFTYDYMNRLTRIDEIHPDGTFSKHYRYDRCSNPIATLDILGNETNTEYDEFNRPVRVIGAPLVNALGQLYHPVTSYEYDPLGHPIKITSPEGYVTEFAYTLYGKPYLIHYADGTTEHFEYDVEGRLIKEVGKTGIESRYTHDSQGRVTKKECYSSEGIFLFQTESRFDHLHLREEIDAAGEVTSYSYDSLGRKISLTKGDLITTFDYDSLGRVIKTTVRSLSNPQEGSVAGIIYDSMDRILQEWTGSPDGKVLTQVSYAYDAAGNKSEILQEGAAGISKTKIDYDTHGIPVKTIDPEGNITYCRSFFQYNPQRQRVSVIETTDSLGLRTTSIQDTHGKVVQILKKNIFGSTVQKTEFHRNGSGQCLETLETVFSLDRTSLQILNCFEYDCMGRQVAVIQASGTPEEKRSTVQYNPLGQKYLETKPSGESLLFSYDSLGRLEEYRSTDGTVHYRYTYDICSNPIQVENLIDQNASYRTYDIHGRVIEETLANSLSLKMTYTPEGFLKTLEYPDGSSVEYTYEGSLLKKVDRFNQILEYSHEYSSHDLGGRLLESSLIHNLGKITHGYDKKGQFTKITSSYYQEDLQNAYDPLGNLTKRSFQDPHGTENEQFSYDSLSQLTSENAHTYTYDSVHNRCSKDGRVHVHNALNQLLSDGETSFSYDLNLNRSHASYPNGSHTYSYDALDRLKTLQIDNNRYEFFYDEHNRCIAQKTYQNESLVRTEKLLYVGQDDIGTADDQGRIHTLRILGKGLGAEIGAAIALEIHGKTYAPLHDHNGNVTVLVNSSGSTVESYRYTAFGEEQIFDASGNPTSHSLIENPWRYASKRHQGDYLLFGRRFYDPAQGRWLTPDPMGYSAGPNLYAYVSNNPLTHFDFYGLIDDDIGPSYYERAWDSISSAWDSFCDSVSSSYESVRDRGTSLLQNINDTQRDSFAFTSSLSRHAIVTPYVRDAIAAPLHYAAHGNFDEYPFTWSQETSQSVCGQGEHTYPDLRLVEINGIDTTLTYFKETLNCHSELFGTRVDGAYNSTGTIPGDLIEVGLQKMGIPTHSVDVAVQTIRASINELGGTGSRGIVAVPAHSQGGQILDCALKHLTREEKNMMAVCTLGTAKIIRDPDLRYVVNFISDCDHVTEGADFFTYKDAKNGLVPEVTFLPSQGSKYFDHSVRDPTYETGLKMFRDNLYGNIMRN